MTFQRGRIYRIKSRNLRIGAFDGERGFIGVREKFGHRFLEVESLADGGPFGTVKHVGAVIGDLPPEMDLRTSNNPVCESCGRPVEWTGPPAPAPWRHVGGDAWVGEHKIRPISYQNDPLWRILDPLDRAEG